jgi:mannose-6-phosphate isomerase
VDDGGARKSLPDWIGSDRIGTLGPGHEHLPFLAKLLAAERSLSVQVHPDAARARAGHAREVADGTPAEARCYPDANAKHEVLVALSRFELVCGFRPDPEVDALLDAFPSLADARQQYSGDPLAVRVFERLQGLSGADRKGLADEARAFAEGDGLEASFVGRLADEHPGDPLVAAPLFLNPLVLEPGSGLVVRPGTVHSYLCGVGVEVMTRSDNVIRAGLTPKHVDAREVAIVTQRQAGAVEVLSGRASGHGVTDYATGTDAFRLCALDLADGDTIQRDGRRVTVLFCVEGDVGIDSDVGDALSLACGEAVLVPASIERYRLRGSDRTSKVFEVSSG